MDSQSLRKALPDRLETDRLVLRAPELGDAAAMAMLANNRQIHEMTTLPYPYGETDAIAFIADKARSAAEYAYVIALADGTMIGTIGIHLKDEGDPELGYWLGEPFWGQGYATEAARALVETTLSLCPALRAVARSENHASRAVLEKIGFVPVETKLGACGPHKGISITTFAAVRSQEARS